jgi:hypothetical protein
MENWMRRRQLLTNAKWEFVVLTQSPSVDAQPSVELNSWSIRECPRPDGQTSLHFCGKVGERGRVSSAILTLDWSNRRGTTSSSRVYRLIGDPAQPGNEEVEKTWMAWTIACGIHDDQDVTKQLMEPN